MPRNVRNFWLQAYIDGRTSDVATGPKNKDGGFTLTIYQRSKGDIVKALTVTGVADSYGTLVLYVDDENGFCRIKQSTGR